MRNGRRTLSILLLVCGLALPLTSPVAAEAPKSEDEVALDASDESALQIRRKLFAARQEGDAEKIKDLEKQFEKAQKERVRLLRKTWQM